MDVADSDDDVSTNSDESIENIFETLVSELVDYREALCNLVIVSRDNSETSHFNSTLEDDEISHNGNEIVMKPANGKKDCSDISIKSDKVRDSFSVDKKIKISDLGIRDFQPGNSKNSSKEAMIPNDITVVGTPCQSSDLMICSSGRSMSGTLNNSCRDAEGKTRASNAKFSDYGSEAPINISDKDAITTLNFNSPTSTTDFTFSDSDSNITSYLKILDKYLGASSSRILTEECLRKSINQYLSQRDLQNNNPVTSMDPKNYSQSSTDKSSQDPGTGLDYIFSDSSPNPFGILNASDRSSESSNSDLNISNRDSEIRHSVLSVSDEDKDTKPSEESLDVLLQKLEYLFIAFNEFQDASVKVSEDIITEISNMAPTLDNYRETSFSSDTEMEKGVPTKTVNTADRHCGLNIPTRDVYRDSNSIQSKVLTISDFIENLNSDFKFSDSDAESYHSDLMYTDSDNESKSNKRLHAFHVQKEPQNAINTNVFQNLRQEEVITAKAFSNIQFTSDNDIKNLVSLRKTKGNDATADDHCHRVEPLVYFEDPNPTAEFQTISERVSTTEAFSNIENASDNDIETSVSLRKTKGNDASAHDRCHRVEPLVYFEDPNPTAEFQTISERVSTTEAFSKTGNTSDNDIETSVSLDEIKGNGASADSTIADDQCDWIEPLVYFEDLNAPHEVQNISEEVITAEAFSNIELTSDMDLGSSVSSHETKGNAISGYSKNRKDECDRLEALVCSNYTSATAEFQGIGQEVISSGALSNMELTSDYGLGTSTGSHDTEGNKAYLEMLQFASYLEDSEDSGSVSDDVHNLMLSQMEQESKFGSQPPDVLEALKELRNQMSTSFKNQCVIQKRDTTVEAGCNMKPILNNEQINSVYSHGMVKNEISSNLENTDNLRTQTVDHSDTSLLDSAKENYFSKCDSNPSQTPKISNGNKASSTNKEERRQNAEMNSSFRINNNLNIPIDCVETKDSDSDTLDDIFKRVIKCHPIKKFEIHPYESANAGRTLEKSVDPFNKDVYSAIERNGIDGYRTLLEVISDTDSSSVMVFDVTDSFSQNSSIICDGLIKEYLHISGKVDLFLIKRVKDLSAVEYELKMRRLQSLDDELGYINAKLISEMNHWVKQFREIEENIEQSIIRSRGLYHMGILEICLQLVCILINFSYEKQLNLENYEKALIFERNRYI